MVDANPPLEEVEDEDERQYRQPDTKALIAALRNDLTAGMAEGDEMKIWGVVLASVSQGAGRGAASESEGDVLLFKFLLARELDRSAAKKMITDTLEWRTSFWGECEPQNHEIPGSNFLSSIGDVGGIDAQGRPIVFSYYGKLYEQDVWDSAFSSSETGKNFSRWRLQLMERSVTKMDLGNVTKSTLVLVHDLDNLPMGLMTSRTAHLAIAEMLEQLNDNYPEMAAKHIIINAPMVITAILAMLQPFITKRTQSRIKYCSPAGTMEMLRTEIGEENIPSRYFDQEREAASATTSFWGF